MADDPQLLTDIRLELRHHELRPVYVVATDRQRLPGAQSAAVVDDLGLISGRDNLAQAIIMRLLTPRGELSPLAHPEYGSRLHELVGRWNTETTRSLVKLYILESLQMEARIDKLLDVSVNPDPVLRDRVAVSILVRPIGSAGVVTIGPFTLELRP